MKRSAEVSKCGQYRYHLGRTWDENLPSVLFIMLNPSEADAVKDDPTLRRCIAFAKHWGFGSLMVCNWFAWRSKNPKDLIQIPDPIGPDNYRMILHSYAQAHKTVFAWGNSDIMAKMKKRFPQYNPIAGIEGNFIELAKDGTPRHPLYLKSTFSLKPFKK